MCVQKCLSVTGRLRVCETITEILHCSAINYDLPPVNLGITVKLEGAK